MDIDEKLIEAAHNGNHLRIKRLLKKGADVNFRNRRSSDTALHKATRLGYLDCVNVLLENGADPNLANNAQETPLFNAVFYASEHQLVIIEELLKHKALIDFKSLYGFTPLMLGIQHIDVVQLLLEQGADYTIKNDYDNTALDQARIQSEKDDKFLVVVDFMSSFEQRVILNKTIEGSANHLENNVLPL